MTFARPIDIHLGASSEVFSYGKPLGLKLIPVHSSRCLLIEGIVVPDKAGMRAHQIVRK